MNSKKVLKLISPVFSLTDLKINKPNLNLMKRTFSFFPKRNALLCLMLSGFLSLLGTNSMNAQESARGFENPEVSIAQYFNVTAYDILTFDPAEAIATLEAIATQLKQLMPTATPAQKMKYQYLSAVLQDVEAYDIAVEISLLKQLEHLSHALKTGPTNSQTTGGVPSQFPNLYNEIITALQ